MRNMRLVVVDDDPTWANMLDDYIKCNNEPMEIIKRCSNGIELLEYLETIDINVLDALILDISMPQMNGLRSMHEMKSKYGLAIMQKILLTSVYLPEPSVLEEFKTTYGITFPPIGKPCMAEEVFVTLKMVGLTKIKLEEKQLEYKEAKKEKVLLRLKEYGINTDDIMGSYLKEILFISIDRDIDILRWGVMTDLYKELDKDNHHKISSSMSKLLHKKVSIFMSPQKFIASLINEE